MKIIRQASALQTYLSTNASKLRASKTLIVASAPPPPPDDNNLTPQKTDQKLKKFHSSFEQHIGQCHFFTGMQHNLQTVSYGYNGHGKDNYTLAGAYPTPQNVDATVALMKRAGAIHVMGVGSGAAMDLAKAAYYRIMDNSESSNNEGGDDDDAGAGQLILNPSTLGATVASVTRGGLVMDPDEEALLPLPLPLGNYSNSNSNVTVLIDDKAMCIPSWIYTSCNSSIGAARNQRGTSATIVESALASLVMALDAAYSYGEMDHENDNDVGGGGGGGGDYNKDHYRFRALLQESISGSLSCLNAFQSISNNSDLQIQEAIQSGRQHAIQAMISSGQLLSYGALNANADTDGRRRNIALAFTSALLPEYFPHGNWCTFTASLLPGLCHAIDTEDSSMVEDNSMLQHALSMLHAESGSAPTSAFEWANNLNVGQNDSVASIHVPSLASLAEGAPDPNDMIQKVEDNGAFVNCLDADTSYLETIFMTSLNR